MAMLVDCCRLGRQVSDTECPIIIWETTCGADLVVCQQCSQGKMLMASCPISGRKDPGTESVELAAATRVLPLVLEYVLPRYPDASHHGVRFLALVAEGQFGFKGGAEALAEVAKATGLRVDLRKGRAFVVVDNAARTMAGGA